MSGNVLGTGKRVINRTKSLISLRTGYYETNKYNKILYLLLLEMGIRKLQYLCP